MILNRITLSDFRNIENADITFQNGVNVFVGNNAQGKTNVLEAIYLSATEKSFRTNKEREMIRFDAPYFTIGVDFTDKTRTQTLETRIYADIKRKRACLKNGVACTSIAETVGVFRAVLFCPEYLSMIKSGPNERRQFLDMALCQLRPVYYASLSQFKKLVTQRNALLKQLADNDPTADRVLLDVLSERIARESARIYRNRQWYIGKLETYTRDFYARFRESAGVRELPTFRYHTSLHAMTDDVRTLSEEEAYREYLRLLGGNTVREIAAGATLYGSHKDDILIDLNGQEARLYASQGQQRSLTLAMKLAEGAISADETKEQPVFLFDDVLSELDTKRQTFLLSQLNDRQVIMTSCTLPPLDTDAYYIAVENGRYRPYRGK